jgi:TrmH family RNA methyltransferase
MQNSVSIVMGNEHSGISNFWIENSDELVKIPMNGAIDSMNISNAAAIMMYEVVRQRSI